MRALAWLLSAAFAATTIFAQSSPQSSNEGAAIFAGKGACQTCHRVGGRGSRLGPDLTDIGANRTPEQLQVSLLDPNAEILPENRAYRVTTRNGETVTGRLNLDTYQILMMDPKEQLRSFQKSELREHGFVKGSAMPSYRDKLTDKELADVVVYLSTLKGVTSQ